MDFLQRHLSRPLSVQFEITNICNHRCRHCYNLDSNITNRPNQHADDDTVMRCAEKIVDNKIFSVVITGGEPLMNRKLTEKLIAYFYDNSIKINLNSNITLFDSTFIEFLKSYKVSLLTSCPSGDSNSYRSLVGVDNFPTFEKYLKRIVQVGIPCTVNMVVTKDNYSQIKETAKWVKSIGCSSFAATPMSLNMEYPRYDLLLSTEMTHEVIYQLLWCETALGLRVDILEALPKCAFPKDVIKGHHRFLNRKCQAGRTGVAISPFGEVRPCAHNPVSYGNILNDSLEEIWSRMYAWRNDSLCPIECKNCGWLSKCYGGCRVNAKTKLASWNAPDIWFSHVIPEKPLSHNRTKLSLSNDQIITVNNKIRFRQEDSETIVGFNYRDNIYFMINC